MKLYPPKNHHDLRNLFEAIVNAPAAEHEKHALLYYILKDCTSTTSSTTTTTNPKTSGHVTNPGDEFAKGVFLSQRYKLFIDGLHDLDRGRPREALEVLTSPPVPTTMFSDHILLTLLSHYKVDPSLSVAYCVTVQPPFEEQSTLEAYYSMLCSMSVFQAYTFCQTRTGPRRKALFEQLIFSVMTISSSQAKGQSSTKNGASSNNTARSASTKAESLISLPFTDEEVTWFEDFLLHGKASSCPGSKDTVIMRRIATGRDFSDVGPPHILRNKANDGFSWEDVARGVGVVR